MQQFLLHLTLLFSTAGKVTTASAIPFTNPPQPAITSFPSVTLPPVSVHKVATIDSQGFENLAFRSNGEILATTAFPSALVWYIDPMSIRPPILLHNFTSLTATGGITELAPDIFYVAAYGPTEPPSIYSIDMRLFLPLPNGTVFTPPVIKEIGKLPPTSSVNGMTHLGKNDDFVLVADTQLGGVWKFDIKNGNASLIIQDLSMKGPPNEISFRAFGINGIRIQNQTLFYTNSGKQTMSRIAVSPPCHDSKQSYCNSRIVSDLVEILD